MCKLLDYPRSTYYDKQKEKPENKWKKENKKLQEDILKIYNAITTQKPTKGLIIHSDRGSQVRQEVA
ncbi:hypothetical protein [Schnuerera sp.]|uniref:hypothetical protein n=1 Tax=Schnuerera sp. TaxID=2794844 RepID=UPI002C0EA8F9|nr:hypothetical protein [Schnuerera sp.]HSH37026.1 hypothetical protein [Schnuerera sp.]